MATLLRQIVASPRARHPEAGLDLCYVTDNIIATSGPSSVWPKKAYRNPTDQLVKFLDDKHDSAWAIFEFRAEGTGYPDSEVYNRIHHFPWPDHHPPPFAIIPALTASMRNWIRGDGVKGEGSKSPEKAGRRRVAVVHCKAGKGRSGTAACSYLISEEGWKLADALQRFTDRRMRVGFGNGVSIPSQLRWVGYVDRWTNTMNKQYVERPVEVVELHVWGLRDGVKVAIEGYVQEGRRIQCLHTFNEDEKIVVDDDRAPAKESKSSESDSPSSASGGSKDGTPLVTTPSRGTPLSSSHSLPNDPTSTSSSGATVILKPSAPIILPTSDTNIDFERRNKASYTSWAMVTSVAHVWFNAYFEGGHEGNDSGVFEIEWEAMDGIKGSARKGTKALDRLMVVWRYPSQDQPDIPPSENVITQPAVGEPVHEPAPADWRGDQDREAAAEASHSGGVSSGRPGGALLTVGATMVAGAESFAKDLGLRKEDPTSADISRPSSVRGPLLPQHLVKGDELARQETMTDDEDRKGVKAHGPDGEGSVVYSDGLVQVDGIAPEEEESKADTRVGRAVESGVRKLGEMLPGRGKTPDLRNGHETEKNHKPGSDL